MNRIVAIFALLMSSVCRAATEIYFTPSPDCENGIIERIDAAGESLDAAVYSINNANIISALERAKERGLHIRILTDKTQAGSKSSKVRYLHDQGFNIKVHTKYKLEHNKFAVYDDNMVSTGSFNWTNPASLRNSENCVFLSTKKSAKEYKDRFEELWKLNDGEKSEVWFD